MTTKPIKDAAWFLGKEIPEHAEYRIARKLGSGLNAQVFVAHSDPLERDIACKIIPRTRLRDPESRSWRDEITNANRINSSRVVKIFAEGLWNCPEGECIYLLSDLVIGISLREYVKDHHTLEFYFVITLLEELLDFLRELKAAKLQHGDLHEGNILVEDRSEALTGPPFAFRITDFGVAPATSGGELLDDFDQVGRLMRNILQKINYQELAARDRVMYDYVREDFLAKALPESDPSFDARARDPKALFDSLAMARSRSIGAASAARKTLTTPFDYLSCEQIGEAHVLLKELYSDKFLGLREIEDHNNLVLTGPRGCGKTTVFRCLSIKHRIRTGDDSPTSLQFIGVYYRCDDLYFSFPRYLPPARPEGIDVPMHFLTATLLRELLESLLLWLPRHFESDWDRLEATVASALWELLGTSRPNDPAALTFPALIASLDKQRSRAAQKQRFVSDPNQKFGTYFGPDMLPRACTVLSTHLDNELASKPIVFLIDDYSAPKITVSLQESLNRLLMQRTPACFFKLATESPTSYASSDIDGKSYVEGREFRLLNLGMDFINAEREDKLRFVDDVFNKRFTYAESFPIKTLQEFVGDDPDEDYNSRARRYRQGQRPEVWGRGALAELCSGDVHYLIDLAGKMTNLAGGSEELKRRSERPAIRPALQSTAIRQEAGNFLKNLRALPKGSELVDIVEAFASVAASYIRHVDSKNETGAPPHQASRIEPFEDPSLSADARGIYDDLLRYSVFLEDVRGRSRRGFVVPRLYLRRFLIPFFNLTFSKRDSLELNVEELHELLLNPKRFETRKRLREDMRGDDGQLPLLVET